MAHGRLAQGELVGGGRDRAGSGDSIEDNQKVEIGSIQIRRLHVVYSNIALDECKLRTEIGRDPAFAFKEHMMRIPAVLLGVILAFAAVPQVRSQNLQIEGRWKSERLEPQGKLFVSRDFTFAGDSWSVVYRAHADANGANPLFTLDVGGIFVVGERSTTLPEAHDGIFPARRRNITADSAAGVAMFAAMGCTLLEGVPKALVSEGCGFVPPLMTAMGEYDLVTIKDGKLFFGDRSGDLTKARPQSLYAFPLIKQ